MMGGHLLQRLCCGRRPLLQPQSSILSLHHRGLARSSSNLFMQNMCIRWDLGRVFLEFNRPIAELAANNSSDYSPWAS
eukprot:3218287-Amphidinium_carterae.2